MHGMTDITGEMWVLATLLLQRGHGSLDELWELEVLLLILFLGGLVAVVAWLVVRIFPRVRRHEPLEAPRDSAEEILRERFARGEITAEELQRSIENLRGVLSPPSNAATLAYDSHLPRWFAYTDSRLNYRTSIASRFAHRAYLLEVVPTQVASYGEPAPCAATVQQPGRIL